MSFKVYNNINRHVPQSSPLLGEKQVVNNAGGFVYALDPWKTFERFIILGTEGGSYYVKESKLTREGAENAIACIEADGIRAVDLIVAISDAGRAAKNDPAIFALALAASSGGKTPTPDQVKTRQYALSKLDKVCRIPTHLYHFNAFVEQFRGRSSGLNKAIVDWCQRDDVDQMAYSFIKYQQRDGWSARDILRLTKPKPRNNSENALYHYVTKGWDSLAEGFEKHENKDVPAIVWAFEEAKKVGTKKGVIKLIEQWNLSREMIPTEFLSDPDVQWALLQRMPPHALLRNLGNLGKSGLLKPLSKAAKLVCEKLSQYDALRKKRVHPMDVIVALKVYGSGHGVRGDGAWEPVQTVTDALNDLFYKSFDFVEPTGKRFLLGLDVSGSMAVGISGSNGMLSCCEAATLMALVTAKTEKQYEIMAFNQGIQKIPITPRMSLEDALKYTKGVNFGGTDCSLPMIYAKQNKLAVDCFGVFTDNETWAGRVHPSVALRDYRSQSGIAAKQVVCGMTALPFTIADPKDSGTLDVVGFDTATPAAIAEFARI